MSNARKLADNLPTEGSLSGRNMIMNGDFKIWQRGNTVAASGGLTADRWYAYSTDSGVGNYTVSVSKVTGTNPLGEYANYASIAQSGTQTGINYLTFGQRIESSITRSQLTAGDKVTFSCYIKRKQAAASDIKVHVRSPSGGVDNYQSGQTLLSAYDTSVAIPYTNTFNNLALNTWVRIIGTFDANSAMANRGCAVFLENGPSNLGVNNTNALYETTGWQLEVGPQASPFEHEPFGVTLSKCERYFYKLPMGTYGPFFCQYVSSHRFAHIWFPTKMRTTPTSTATNAGGTMYEYYPDPYSTKYYITAGYDSGSSAYLQSYQADAEL